MQKRQVPIEKYMTPSPHSVGVEQPLARARAMMNEHGIRHLPVLHGGALVGILSHGDLRLAESLGGVDSRATTVEEAMSPFVYAVRPDQPLEEVVTTMAETKRGSAVVMQREKVVGIFTMVDACRALADILHVAAAPG